MKRLLLIASLVLAACSLRAADDKPAEEAKPETSVFADPALEAAVREQVFEKRGTDKPLTAADVANVAFLNGNFRGVRSLSGLEHCRALASIDLAGNGIVDLTPLQGLPRLQYLNLASNRVADLTPLGTLPALQYVQLDHNAVTNLAPLAACTNLASLYVSHNRVTTLEPILGLARMATLYADDNRIDSVAGIDALKGLTSVSLSGNRIRNIAPLAGLRAPMFLMLERNRIRNIGGFHKAALADLEGPQNWAPFVRVRLQGNFLSPAARRQAWALSDAGMRIEQ